MTSTTPPMPNNIDYLGRSVDILYFDPLSIKDTMIDGVSLFVYSMENSYTTGDGANSVPNGVDFLDGNEAVISGGSYQFSSTEEYENEFGKNFKAGMSGPGEKFSFSKSASYQRVKEETATYSFAYQYQSSAISCYTVNFKNLSQLELDSVFSEAVRNLPVSGDTAAAYGAFINRFKTHYTSKINMGGCSYLLSTFSLEGYGRMVRNFIHIKEELAATLEGVTGQAGQEWQNNHQQYYENQVINSIDKAIMVGGQTQYSDWSTWAATVPANPMPVTIDFHPLSDLLVVELFPNDPDISTKRNLLANAIETYIISNGEEAGGSSRFWSLSNGYQTTRLVGSKTGNKSYNDSNFFAFTPSEGNSDHKSFIDRVAKIEIWHGSKVDALRVTWDGKIVSQGMKNGGNGGALTEIRLNGADAQHPEDEYITKITGRAGDYLDQLKFYTNRGRVFGPYGGGGGEPFEIDAGCPIWGFHGSYESTVHTFGVILAQPMFPNQRVSWTEYGEQLGGYSGYPFFDELNPVRHLRKIHVRSGSEIDSIQCVWEGYQGETITGARHGHEGGTLSTITLASDEYLKALQVKYGDRINRLTFITNKRSYGPYGGGGGHTEATLDSGGDYAIGGFYGRCREKLDAVAIYRGINYKDVE